MPSILSGCLILLKIAMAVNEGLHSMLSSIYSILENVMSSDHAMEPVQDSDSPQVVLCSKSRILEAFNRRRANLPTFEQTEIYVTNMNPYQEITITNKDYDGKEKRSSSVKKSQSMDLENNQEDFRSNEEICSSCPGTSQSCSPSLVSSDTGNESEYQSCKTLNGSVELDKNIASICVEDELDNVNPIVVSSTEEETSIEADESPNSSFLEVLQSKIKLISEVLQGALSNVKNPSTENVYGLKDSESIKKSSSEDCTNSPPEMSACRKQLWEETAGLYKNFLQNYYHRNEDKNPKAASNESGSKRSTETSISNGNKPTLEEGSSRINSFPICHQAPSPWQVNESQQKQNPLPSIIISDHSSFKTDSDCPGYNLSGTKSVSKTSATKRINTYQFPISLQKDRWIEVDDFEQSKIGDSKTLHQNEELLEKSASIQSTKFDVSQLLVSDDISSEDSNNVSGDVRAFDRLLTLSNLSNHPFNFSHESDIVSLDRVYLLKKVLQDVGAAEVLEESNEDAHQPQSCTLNFLSKEENSHLEKCTIEESEIVSVPMQTDLLDVDHIPLKELDTEDKQITYLNDLTEHYRKQIIPFNQKSIEKQENDLLGNLEKRHKMTSPITNGSTNQLDSIIRSARMCRNELHSIDTDLKTIVGVSSCKQGASNTKNSLQITSPQASTSVRENHAPGLPVFLTNSAAKPLKVVDNEKMSATCFTNNDNGLIETESNCRATFTPDSARTETSTPIKDKKIEDPSWVSINLSSESYDEHSVTECKDISCMYYPKLRRNILFNDRELFHSKQEIEPSENVKEDISLEAEDWRNLAAHLSKNYEDVVSLLNSIDDTESIKKEPNSSDNEDCTGLDSTGKAFVENCDRVTEAQMEQPTNVQSKKELDEVTIPCCERKFNNASPSITDNKIINLDSFNAVLEYLQNENFANENASFKILKDPKRINNYQESYLNSTDNNAKETKSHLVKLTTDSYEKSLKFQNMKSKSSLGTENDNLSDVGKSTPISNMEDLIKREELETIKIYDDFQVCDKVENCSNFGDLSKDNSNHNLGSTSETTMLPIKK